MAADGEPSAAGGNDPRQGPQGRRFASAVGADQTEDLTRLHEKGKPRHGDRVVVRLMEIFNFDHAHFPTTDSRCRLR